MTDRPDGPGSSRRPGLPPFDTVVRDHGATVLRVCRALLSQADADDAWSETFLAALRGYPSVRPDSNIRGWLVTIAHHKAIDVHRRTARSALPVAEIPEVAGHDPAPGGLLEIGDPELRAALAGLADKQRTCVVLHHIAGLSYREIAAVVGGSEAAARRAAADGIARLRLLYR